MLDLPEVRIYMLIIEGSLEFARKDVALDANYIFVFNGALTIGTETEPVSAAARGFDPADVLDKAVSVAGFKGKAYATVDILAPKDSPADRIAIVGAGLNTCTGTASEAIIPNR